MKIKTCFLLLMLLPYFSFAQITISGQVVDANTQRALSGAHIYNLNDSTGTICDQKGNFQLYSKTSTCKISCHYPGFYLIQLR